MAESNKPKKTTASDLLPKFYRSDANKKFLQATIDQLIQPGTVKKINGYIGRQNSKSTTGSDIFIEAADTVRQNYQLEPGLVINDTLGNTTFFKDYQDYINQLNVFGGNVSNHARVNKQEFYSWDPHINWDKFVNFQNYYWLPYGPDVIRLSGQQQGIVSTYRVEIQAESDNNTYLFFPTGLEQNPTLQLYRGQTYRFEISSPGNPFSIKTKRTAGSFDRYEDAGITGQAVENGVIEFTISQNSPDVLYYVSENDVNLGGVLQILSIDENTVLNVETDILGKKSYTLPDGTELSNGMKLSFVGKVIPEQYETGQYYVEGIGDSIRLINESILQIVSPYTTSEAILFDNTPFDSTPWSDATSFAGSKDYIVVNRGSDDHNPWSRYNRWFHKDVIDASARYNNKVPSIDQTARAVRPIIEFDANLKLFNFGTTAIADVDLIDTYTTDVFSKIEGQLGYNIDGIDLAQGQRILFTADTDILVKNRIYKVNFLVLDGVRQIHLEEQELPELNQVVLIKQGFGNRGLMYWFDGSAWQSAQQKTTLNQAPKFDIVNDAGVSYGDKTVYDGSTFAGTKLFSYKIGSGTADATLGFPLAYKNIANIGDIVFNFDLATDTFQYKNNTAIETKQIDVGYLVKTTPSGTSYVNGWQQATVENVQAGVRIYKNSTLVNNFPIDIFDNKDDLSDLAVKIYINGIFLDSNKWSYGDSLDYKTIVLATDIGTDDILTIKAYAKQPINTNGYYEIPINLQNNPLNNSIVDFTLGEVIDHVGSIVENLNNFQGVFPGANNLRDLGNITSYGTKFVQHSGPASLSLYHVTSDTNNVVRAIESSRDDYNKFKRNFISIAESLGVDTDPVRQVNLILQEINKDKPKTAPYYFSDMVPYTGSIRSDLTVVDYRIKTYPMSGTFNLDTLSSGAVLVYLNNEQLLYKRDYTFSDQGFVVISAPLANGDAITIYEFENTNGCYVPQTPTKLGIWPKYEPKIYTDTSLVTPRVMIQGHDGSQVLAYGDYRDALILELEKRIYNNIKVEYDPSIFDIEELIPSYNRSTDYSLSEFNEVLSTSFYKWTVLIDRDFTKPLSYNRDDSLTFNYRELAAPDGRSPLPGYWKGVYRWMLGTDRPNICPWEMLGFSEKPLWWEAEYGPAPYTSDNLILWNDLADGIIREPGKPPVQRQHSIRSYLKDRIPVDENGNIISPIFSGLATGIITNSTAGDFIFGDVSPVESAWRRSSYYPFSVLVTAMLLHPAKTFGTLLDRSRVVRNLAGQIIYKDTGVRIKPADIQLPSIYSSTTNVKTSGIINYLVDYILSDNLKSYAEYKYDLENADIRLSHRIGSYSSKEKFKLLLDSKTPLSSGSVFVPQEDYDIILNTSSPIKKITYSAVVVTKLNDGYAVKGYSRTQPYFKYYPYVKQGVKINIGGISESFVEWTAGEQYAAGKIVSFNGRYYRSKALHTTTNLFDINYYQPLTELPIVGGRDAYIRKEWDRSETITVPYGVKFRTVQEVVDFLVGYGEWLKDQGFVFDDFNTELNAITNWETSAKEFLFWTTQNWSAGQDKWKDWLPDQHIIIDSIVRYTGDYYRALRTFDEDGIFDEDDFVKLEGLSTVGSAVISLSPAASKLTFAAPLSVVDDIRNPFNGYEIFKVDGTPIQPNFLNNYREDTAVSYSPLEDGIYGATFYLVQKEQVVVLKNTTLFNDTIYNPESGYRQERIKVAGYISSDWNGSFDIPGFVFDQAKIADWENWKDYALGDIVKHKQFYYTAKAFTPGTEIFNSSDWFKLDSKPSPQLLPNWSYKAGQFEDFYSLDSDNFDADQQAVAQHLIGYQKRQYLSNIIKDDVSEFKFYQGMIVEKGTQNVLNKLFDVLSADGQESIKFYEEWALRVGQYGASSAFDNIEFIIDEADVKNNPQGYELVNSVDPSKVDFITRQTPNDVYLKPIGYNNNPWPVAEPGVQYLRTPGYVRPNDVKYTFKDIDQILSTSITDYLEGDYVWVGFEGREWNVYRYTNLKQRVVDVTYSVPNKELTVTFDKNVDIPVGAIFGIDQVTNFAGFYKVISSSLRSITASAIIENFKTPFANKDSVVVAVFYSQRVTNKTLPDGTVVRAIDRADQMFKTVPTAGELMWTDDTGEGKWAAWEFNPVYQLGEIVNTAPQSGLAYGRRILINYTGNIAIVSTNLGEVVIYDKAGPLAPWLQRQTITAPFISKDKSIPGSSSGNLTPSSFTGDVIAISSDSQWLATGTPRATDVSTKVVNGLNVADETGIGSNLVEQGVVSLYKKDANNIFTLVATIASPVPTSNEKFGSSLAFGKDTLIVGADGANDNEGKVYQLSYLTTVEATGSFNPIGSSGTTVKLSNSSGTILEGMYVSGIGFTSGQYVAQVVNSTTVILSAAPDSTPSGVIEFTITSWRYNGVISTTEQLASGSLFGSVTTISSDNSTLLVSAAGSTLTQLATDVTSVKSNLLYVDPSDNKLLYVDSVDGIDQGMCVIGTGFNPNVLPRPVVSSIPAPSVAVMTNSIIDDLGVLTIGSVTSGTPAIGMVLSGGWISTGAYSNYKVLIVGRAQIYRAVTQSSATGNGYGAQFDVSKTDGVYRVSLVTGGTGYAPGNTIKINGSKLGGADGVNDLLVNVVSTDTLNTGSIITSISWVGVASNDLVYNNVVQDSTPQGGSGAKFKVTKVGTGYDVQVTYPGTEYTAGDTIRVLGSKLGGQDGVNDLVVSVVKTIKTYSGIVQKPVQPGAGTGAVFRITRIGDQYTSVAVTQNGINYVVNDTLSINGDLLTGDEYINDLTLRVTAVNSNGGILQCEIASGNSNARPISEGGLYQITWTGTSENDVWQTNSAVRQYGGPDVPGGGFEPNDKNIKYTITGTRHSVFLSSDPTQRPQGQLLFTSNVKGISSVDVDDTSKLEIGDVVTCSVSGIVAPGTLVEDIPNSTTIVLSKPLAGDLTPAIQLAFSRNISGTVFVYKNENGSFVQTQTIRGTELDFGSSISISDNGDYVAISSVLADGVTIDQGNVAVYENTATGYQHYQDLYNVDPEVSEFFGSKISFMNNFQTLVVYSKGSDSTVLTKFDGGNTTFDNNQTTIVDTSVDSGRIDIYDRYGSKWIFSESLANGQDISTGYSTGLAVGSNTILVGAPYALDQGVVSGRVHEYRKPAGSYSWSVKHKQTDRVNINNIKRAFLYNRETNKLVTYLDVIDSTQGKIPGPADQEIKYKTFYDPAVYASGDGSVTVDEGMSWAKAQVGTLWWDLRTSKFFDSQDDDLVYRNSTWNTLFPGASVDIYEWVETTLKPDQWNARADTDEGIAVGISGTTLYGNDVYGLARKYDSVSKSFKNTYYYWVKNKKTVPNVPTRKISASSIASLIANPRGYGYKYLAVTGSNSFSLVNIKPLLDDRNVVLSVEYWTNKNTDKNIHNEWKIISNNPNTTLPKAIESKWFDSLSGKDAAGRLVPDPALPPKLKYGVEVRPRQGMFVNRFEALKQFIEQTNRILVNQLIVENSDISALESFEVEPSTITGLYDSTQDTDAELRFANIGTYEKPILSPIIEDGRIIGINVVQRGRGYLIAPYFTIAGAGKGAVVRAKIDTRGRIIGADVISSGEGYTSNTIVTVRNYSVLVKSDSSAYGAWSIYSYEPTTQVWSRVQTQSYDVRKFWNYIDWYATGYNEFTAVDYSINSFVELNSIESNINQLVKVRTTSLGTWILLRKYANSSSIDWTQSSEVVGREKGTIQFVSNLYSFNDNSLYGFDASLYDSSIFDNSASTELRIILETLRDKILVDDLKQEYLNLFFTSVRYAFSEQNYIDWIFKTSFVKAKHSVGELKQKVTYNNDNLENFEDYIDEVKPYRTKIREYVSSYDKVDTNQMFSTDFDLPAVYENGVISSVAVQVVDGVIQADTNKITEYPWKHWYDNVGFSVVSIEIANGGSGYTSAPVVRIISNTGSGATARAFITNGRVNRIVLLTKGSGYLSAPTVVIDGGLGNAGTPARAVAIIGEGVVRSNLVKIKFDRLTQKYFITQMEETETFQGNTVVSGSRLQFPLTWAPDVRIGKSTVLINGVEALRANYKLTTVKSTSRGYTSYSGALTFDVAPPKGSVITVTYVKDWSLLSAADRIQYYYDPATGELGKDLAQLMTGVDYGGVVVGGLSFDVGQGWGSVPYYSDKWDSFDATFDDYLTTVSADTWSFTLPYLPDAGTLINLYYSSKYFKSENGDGFTKIYNFDVSAVYPPVVTVSTTVLFDETATTNVLGSDIVTVDSVEGIKLGDIITISPDVEKTIGLNTTVININSTTRQIKLNQILFKDIESGTSAIFTRRLVDPTDCTINPNGTIFLQDAIPTSSVLNITSSFDPIRVDDPLYDLDRVTKVNDLKASEQVLANLTQDYKDLISEKVTLESTIGGLESELTNLQEEQAALLVVLDGLEPSDPLYDPTVSQLNIVANQIDDVEASVIQANSDLDTVNDSIASTAADKADAQADVNNKQAIVDALPQLTNPNAVMPTFVATGNPDNPYGTPTETFTVPVDYRDTFIEKFGHGVLDGDRFVLRKESSDGSVLPQDTDYDTALDGGNLIYSTATGLAADDIIVDGDGFVTPTSSPATEEVVPGQVVDAVAIKVYDRPNTGSAKIKVDSYIGDGVTTDFKVTQQPNSPSAVIVKFTEGQRDNDGVLSSVSTIQTQNEDYILNYETSTVEFITPPADGIVVSIFSFGFNGSNILDLDYFIGDGTQTEFITKASWTDDITYLVYVNGQPAQPGTPALFKTDDSYESINQVGLYFSVPPSAGALINYVLVSGNQQTYAITKTERIQANGSTKYNLQYQVGEKLPAESNMIVRVDQEILKGPNNSYFTIVRNQLEYNIDPAKFLPYTLSITDIVVLADGVLLKTGLDYTVELSGITVKINKSVNKKYVGKELIVSVRQNAGYLYIPPAGLAGPMIEFTKAYDNSSVIEVVSSYNHNILDIQRTAVEITSDLSLTPDTTEYYNYKGLSGGVIQLDRTVIDDNYIWVIQNNSLLTPSVDFKLNDDRRSITLALYPSAQDEFTLITFGSNVLSSGVSYMQFKDMLNRTHFKRLNANKRSKLVKGLKFTDTTIEVEDASNFDLPSLANNKPGIIEIRGERIEYFSVTPKTVDGVTTYLLGQLRRGTLGTGVSSLHKAGSYVQDIGVSETLPYVENSVVDQITSDGTNIVPLTFVPGGFDTTWTYTNGTLTTDQVNELAKDSVEVFVGGYASAQWASNVNYKVDDIVEVGSYTFRCTVAHTSSATFKEDSTKWTFFVGNIRLKKVPYKVHNVNVHPESPEGDVSLDAEFVVDGQSTQLQLTNKLAFGTRVTVVKRTGTDWDGKVTPNVLDADNKIGRFLRSAPGVWYSTIGKYDSTVGSATTFDSENGTFDSTSITFDQG